MESEYQIPSPGKLALNSDRLLDYDEKYLRQFLEIRNISAESLKSDMKHLEDWCLKQPHLPDDPHRSRRIFQTLFLIGGASMEKVKARIDNYYSLRNKFPEILKNRDPCEMGKCLRNPYNVVFPKRTSDHQRIVLFRLDEPVNYDVPLQLKAILMMMDYRICNEVQLGEHWVFDCKHVSLANVIAIGALVPKIVFIWNGGYGLHVEVHFVNVPSYVEPLINLSMKLAKKKKIVDRFHTYSDLEELFEVLPKNIFPAEYGGDGPSCQEIIDAWADTLQSEVWREWFLSQDSICADDSKRIAPPQMDKHNDIFGAEGSFKQLTID